MGLSFDLGRFPLVHHNQRPTAAAAEPRRRAPASPYSRNQATLQLRPDMGQPDPGEVPRTDRRRTPSAERMLVKTDDKDGKPRSPQSIRIRETRNRGPGFPPDEPDDLTAAVISDRVSSGRLLGRV